MQEIIRGVGDGTTRLDLILSQGTALSRGHISNLIKQGNCMVDGKVEKKPGMKPGKAAQIILTYLADGNDEILQPQEIPLSILYEDEDLIAINKPSGMVVHPGAGNKENTLVNALLYHASSLSKVGGEERPGIIHRLDKDTSGVLLVAKNDETHIALSKQLKNREMKKHYCVVVWGKLKETGEINQPITRSKKNRKKMAIDSLGKEALTRWTVLYQKDQYTTADIEILTGRTHQIRVHMSSIGHAVLGDRVYGNKEKTKVTRLMLHAWRITFHHPKTNQEMTIIAPLPDEFRTWLNDKEDFY